MSGGLTVHNLGDWTAFVEDTASPAVKAFDQAILDAANVPDVSSGYDNLSLDRRLYSCVILGDEAQTGSR